MAIVASMLYQVLFPVDLDSANTTSEVAMEEGYCIRALVSYSLSAGFIPHQTVWHCPSAAHYLAWTAHHAGILDKH